MRRFLLVLLLGLFVCGCGASARESEFWQHDSVYKNNEHMYFSLSGYKSPTEETGKLSEKEAWWGIPIEAPF
jgi:hypothetical protein